MKLYTLSPALILSIYLIPTFSNLHAEEMDAMFRVEMQVPDQRVQVILRNVCGIGGGQIKVDGQKIPLVPVRIPDFDRTEFSSKMKFRNATDLAAFVERHREIKGICVAVSLGKDSGLPVLKNVAKALNEKSLNWMLINALEEDEGIFASLHVLPEDGAPAKPAPPLEADLRPTVNKHEVSEPTSQSMAWRVPTHRTSGPFFASRR